MGYGVRGVEYGVQGMGYGVWGVGCGKSDFWKRSIPTLTY